MNVLGESGMVHYLITNKTEIIDLINKDMNCNDLADFHLDVMGASVSLTWEDKWYPTILKRLDSNTPFTPSVNK